MPPTLDVTYLFYSEKWLQEITVDYIAEIKTERRNPSVYSDHFYRYIQRTTNKEIIADVYLCYANLTMKSIHIGDVPFEGGGVFSIEFILTDGTTHTISFEAGCYRETESIYYEVTVVPTLAPYDSDKVHGTLSLALWEEYPRVVYTKDSAEYAVFEGLADPKFVNYTGDTNYNCSDYNCSDRTYYIETELGRLYAMSETVFCFQGEPFSRNIASS